MYRKDAGEKARHRMGIPYFNQSTINILKQVEEEINDDTLGQSVYFGPTALTHIKRLIEMGGSIITDTTLAKPVGAASTHTSLMGSRCLRLIMRLMAAGALPITISFMPGTVRP